MDYEPPRNTSMMRPQNHPDTCHSNARAPADEFNQARSIASQIRQYLGPGPEGAAPWRLRADVPTAAEIAAPKHLTDPDLLEAQQWSTTEEYLHAKYKLLREDGCWPLRQCVDEVRYQPSLLEDQSQTGAKIYESVYLVGATLSRKGLAFKVEFSTRRAGKFVRWRPSKRLKTSTIVALSPSRDCFRTICAVAVVVARPLRDLEVELPQKPAVHLNLANADDVDFDPQLEWIMVEAQSGYWEAYRHTLQALQKMPGELFPLSQYICHQHSDIKPPAYRKPDAVVRDSNAVNTLDSSQQAALNRILHKSLALIQGPPGTGKTFLSVAAVKRLLECFKGQTAPIVVASQTNHALDQLLTLIADFEPHFARLGNQTEDEDIVNHTIGELRKSRQKPVAALKANLSGEQRQLEAQLEEAVTAVKKDAPMLPEHFLKHGLISEQFFHSFGRLRPMWVGDNVSPNPSPVDLWCGPAMQRFNRELPPSSLQTSGEDDADADFDSRHDELDLEIDVDEDRWELLRGHYVPLQPGFVADDGRSFTQREAAHIFGKFKDAEGVPFRYRAALFNYMQHEVKKATTQRLRRLDRACKQLALGWKASTMQTDHTLLKDQRVIGVTLTGLSKYRPLLMSLNPKVVLIEEAAESLEPLNIVACMPSVEHLILVGDHMQLRGRVNCHGLENMPYKLNCSLFERLVSEGFESSMLNVQRRMRPEIRALLNPIYPALTDHKSVAAHPSIRGLQCNLFFYEHFHYESSDGANSRFNEGEANAIVLLARYLLKNGYEPRQITILSFYAAQKRHITHRLFADPVTQSLRHSVYTVDSYQGEENDIVIISLVRNNGYGDIGFLSDQNRVNVSLSRARQGLFIFGSTQSLASRNYLWHQTLYTLQKCHRILDHIPLICTNHGNKLKGIAEVDMAKLDGGCGYACKKQLECGHICERRCHPFPHSAVVCERPCLKSLACGHSCRNQCWNQNHQCSTCPPPLADDGPTAFFVRASQSPDRPGHSPDKKSMGSPSNGDTVEERLRTLPLTSSGEAFRAFANGGFREEDVLLAEERHQRNTAALDKEARKRIERSKAPPATGTDNGATGLAHVPTRAMTEPPSRHPALPLQLTSNAATLLQELMSCPQSSEPQPADGAVLQRTVATTSPSDQIRDDAAHSKPGPEPQLLLSPLKTRPQQNRLEHHHLSPSNSSSDTDAPRHVALTQTTGVKSDSSPDLSIAVVARRVITDDERNSVASRVPNLIDFDTEEISIQVPPSKGRRVWTEQYTPAALDRRMEEIRASDAAKAKADLTLAEGNLIDI